MSDLERRFERLRTGVGFVAAPLLFLLVWFTDFESLADKPAAHRLAAVMAAVVTLWVTEAIPMPLTALLGATACVVLQAVPPNVDPKFPPARVVFAPFADQLMFLFIGSFMLARAIELHGLDRRLALSVLTLRAVGGSPSRVLFAFGATTAFISAWISNTATTAMMFAIGLSILKVLHENSSDTAMGAKSIRLDPRYATGLMLMTSFSASIGGLATPIGTPPNVIGLNFIRQSVKHNGLPVEIPFFEWCLIGVPIVVILYLFMFLYLSWFCPAGMQELPGGREYLLRQRQQLGPWTRGQVSTLIAFVMMVVLWVTPGVVALGWGEVSAAYKWCKVSLPEAVPALLGAGLLFLLPGKKGERVLTWNEATKIDWGVVLLYGGGFAFGSLAQDTGLADALGKNIITLLPNAGSLGFLIAATLVATLVSEATSNTASANIVVPVVIAMAQAAGVDPLEPALIGATFGCSLGFMLPVSTPCNAIVYGSGMVPLGRMIRYGELLDVAGTAVIVLIVRMLSAAVR